MAKYDDASWHYGGNYPKDLPKENGGTHIGIFLAWCINNNLISEFQLEDFGDDIQRVKNKEITGRHFLFHNCDEKFTDEDLNDLGNNFAQDYYNSQNDFTKQHATYLSDYENALNFLNKELNGELKSFYHVEDSWDFYDGIAIILDTRFEQWKSYKNLA